MRCTKSRATRARHGRRYSISPAPHIPCCLSSLTVSALCCCGLLLVPSKFWDTFRHVIESFYPAAAPGSAAITPTAGAAQPFAVAGQRTTALSGLKVFGNVSRLCYKSVVAFVLTCICAVDSPLHQLASHLDALYHTSDRRRPLSAAGYRYLQDLMARGDNVLEAAWSTYLQATAALPQAPPPPQPPSLHSAVAAEPSGARSEPPASAKAREELDDTLLRLAARWRRSVFSAPRSLTSMCVDAHVPCLCLVVVVCVCASCNSLCAPAELDVLGYVDMLALAGYVTHSEYEYLETLVYLRKPVLRAAFMRAKEQSAALVLLQQQNTDATPLHSPLLGAGAGAGAGAGGVSPHALATASGAGVNVPVLTAVSDSGRSGSPSPVVAPVSATDNTAAASTSTSAVAVTAAGGSSLSGGAGGMALSINTNTNTNSGSSGSTGAAPRRLGATRHTRSSASYGQLRKLSTGSETGGGGGGSARRMSTSSLSVSTPHTPTPLTPTTPFAAPSAAQDAIEARLFATITSLLEKRYERICSGWQAQATQFVHNLSRKYSLQLPRSTCAYLHSCILHHDPFLFAAVSESARTQDVTELVDSLLTLAVRWRRRHPLPALLSLIEQWHGAGLPAVHRLATKLRESALQEQAQAQPQPQAQAGAAAATASASASTSASSAQLFGSEWRLNSTEYDTLDWWCYIQHPPLLEAYAALQSAQFSAAALTTFLNAVHSLLHAEHSALCAGLMSAARSSIESLLADRALPSADGEYLLQLVEAQDVLLCAAASEWQSGAGASASEDDWKDTLTRLGQRWKRAVTGPLFLLSSSAPLLLCFWISCVACCAV
jgi:hypothetical protein